MPKAQPAPYRPLTRVIFYHRYRDDIALMAGLGFNAFRFRTEWASYLYWTLLDKIEWSRGFRNRAPSGSAR